MTEILDPRRKRLHYRSWHRGCRETDLILGAFCDEYLADMDDAQLDTFEDFLEEDDKLIWYWIIEQEAPERADFTPIVERLRHFRDYSPA